VTHMGATSDHSPRIALVLQPGPDVQESVRESLTSLCGELDAKALDDIGVLIGALSRTQVSQLEAKDGFELRLWVSDDDQAELEYEVHDLPFATAPRSLAPA
jgi:hypothetical protein